MSIVRGRVRRGHVETEVELPEGADVVVLSGGSEAPFILDDASEQELEGRIASADRGELEPAAAVLQRLHRPR